jgi:predicted PurR-regulated permease PerM
MQPPPMNEPRPQFLNEAVMLACIAALAFGVLAVLRPFLPAILWATIIVVATWPIMLRAQRWFGGRRGLAVAAMSAGLFAVIVAPVALLLGTLITRLPALRDLAARMIAGPWPGPPDWLARLPFGSHLAASWQQATERTPDYWAETVKPYLSKAIFWLGQHLGTLGGITVDFLLTLVLVVVFYQHGEALANLIQKLARRVGGARATESALLAAQAMRAIAAGVVVTALVEAILSGLGLWVAGIPEAAILTSLIFLLCVMQLGTLPVLIPAALWLVSQHQLGWGIALTAWAALMSVGDGVLRSWLIQRGARLPFMLILGGVIGGLLAFGAAGIFIGPVLLAVAQRILERWASEA